MKHDFQIQFSICRSGFVSFQFTRDLPDVDSNRMRFAWDSMCERCIKSETRYEKTVCRKVICSDCVYSC